MEKKEEIGRLAFDSAEAHRVRPDYKDEDVAILYDMRDLPVFDEPMRVDMFISVSCLHGRMQLEINDKVYTIGRYEALICRPNDLVASCMFTPDFAGKALCLTSRFLTENFSESGIWNSLFLRGGSPVIRADEEDIRLFDLFCEMLHLKTGQACGPYRREIIYSIVRAAMYECLAKINGNEHVGAGQARRCEVLFKQFIRLLSDCPVRPRSVAWYADRMCVTPKHLSTVCKQVSGKTAFEWINEYVRKDVRYRLKHSDRSIKEVADGLGFPNLSFFGKYCRQHFGVSPTEYRKQLRDVTAGRDID